MKRNKTDTNKPRPKPESTPFFRYYFIDPIQGFVWELHYALVGFWRWFTDAWYCDYCHKYHGRRVTEYHGRRVTKFTITQMPAQKIVNTIIGQSIEDLHVCSLGRDAQLNNAQCNKDQAT